MAKRILVPLDHTTAVESVVPLIADIARSAGAAVRVLHVESRPGNVETREGRVIAYADQEMDRLEAGHAERLRAVVEPHLAGVPFDCVVRFGETAAEIVAEIEAFDADLVAVGTRTRSSLSRALLGSVAEELLRKAPVTVMLVRPSHGH
jgi:nucleotide-binding universal stress UspA family protein